MALLLGLGLISASAQVPNSPIVFDSRDGITVSLSSTPNFGGDTSSSASEAAQWLKIEFHYAIAPALGDFQDAVEFKVWVEGLDPNAPNATQPSGKGVAVGLTGSITYVNIPRGKDNYGVFYVHPSTLARYSGTGGTEDFTRKFDVHISAYVGGAEMDRYDRNKETDPLWYTHLKAIPNLVYRQDQSPFILASPDRYPGIKLVAPPAQ